MYWRGRESEREREQRQRARETEREREREREREGNESLSSLRFVVFLSSIHFLFRFQEKIKNTEKKNSE